MLALENKWFHPNFPHPLSKKSEWLQSAAAYDYKISSFVLWCRDHPLESKINIFRKCEKWKLLPLGRILSGVTTYVLRNSDNDFHRVFLWIRPLKELKSGKGGGVKIEKVIISQKCRFCRILDGSIV